MVLMPLCPHGNDNEGENASDSSVALAARGTVVLGVLHVLTHLILTPAVSAGTVSHMSDPSSRAVWLRNLTESHRGLDVGTVRHFVLSPARPEKLDFQGSGNTLVFLLLLLFFLLKKQRWGGGGPLSQFRS